MFKEFFKKDKYKFNSLSKTVQDKVIEDYIKNVIVPTGEQEFLAEFEQDIKKYFKYSHINYNVNDMEFSLYGVITLKDIYRITEVIFTPKEEKIFIEKYGETLYINDNKIDLHNDFLLDTDENFGNKIILILVRLNEYISRFNDEQKQKLIQYCFKNKKEIKREIKKLNLWYNKNGTRYIKPLN